MSWESLGYESLPFATTPIRKETMELFVGHEKKINICDAVLEENNSIIVIEGGRGVGTTSFGNYLRFNKLYKKVYFTIEDEISVEPNWNLEMLLSAVISEIVKEMQFVYEKEVKNNKGFNDVKALSYRLSESYSSFGINAFSIGASYGKSTAISMPAIIPSNVLWHHLEILSKIAIELGYEKGILVQLNNLDIYTVHSEEHLKYLFNTARDYLQRENFSWLLVGDVGLKSFIARKVDRLDDIISYNIVVSPMNKLEYHKLIKKRLVYYKRHKQVVNPFAEDVYDYLFEVSNGRLRYIFSILSLLFKRINPGLLIHTVDLDLAKKVIIELIRERLQQHKLSSTEKLILEQLVEVRNSNVMDLAKNLNKNRSLVSRILNSLLNKKLVTVIQEGVKRVYAPSIDAKIAYSGSRG